MLLRKLEDRSTGRRVSGGGGGGASGGNDGDVGSAFPLASSSSPPPTPTSPRPPPPSRLASSLAASADLAPRLRVVATYDGHVGCVNAVSFAGERAERLVTGEGGGAWIFFLIFFSSLRRCNRRGREKDKKVSRLS